MSEGEAGGPSATRALEPKQQRSTETRRRLLDAAIDELLANGHAGLTTHSVALRAGVTRGAQQHHFPRKDLLIAEAIRHLTERQLEGIQERIRGTKRGRQRLERALDVMYEQYSGPLFAASLELTLAAQHEPELRPIVAEHERSLSQGIIRSALDIVDPAVAAEPDFSHRWAMAIGTARGIALLRILGHPPEVVDRHWRHALAELVRILS